MACGNDATHVRGVPASRNPMVALRGQLPPVVVEPPGAVAVVAVVAGGVVEGER